MRSIVRSERRDRVAGIRGSLSLVKLETPAVDGAPTSPTGSRANVKERSPAAAGFCFRGPRPGIVLRGRPTLEESRITTRIAAAALPLLLSAVAPVAAEAMSTRFGTLSINNQYLLLFNGRPLSPKCAATAPSTSSGNSPSAQPTSSSSRTSAAPPAPSCFSSSASPPRAPVPPRVQQLR